MLAGMAYGSGHESKNGEEEIQSIIDVDNIEENAESKLSTVIHGSMDHSNPYASQMYFLARKQVFWIDSILIIWVNYCLSF